MFDLFLIMGLMSLEVSNAFHIFQQFGVNKPF